MRIVSEGLLRRALVVSSAPPQRPKRVAGSAAYDRRAMAWIDGSVVTYVKYADDPRDTFSLGVACQMHDGRIGRVTAVDGQSLTVAPA